MARPKKGMEQIDLNTIDQLNFSIDLGDKYNYRFETHETINLTTDEAQSIKNILMRMKPEKRLDYISEMMLSRAAFVDIVTVEFSLPLKTLSRTSGEVVCGT